MQPIVESIGKRSLSGSFENVQGEPSCSMRVGARWGHVIEISLVLQAVSSSGQSSRLQEVNSIGNCGSQQFLAYIRSNPVVRLALRVPGYRVAFVPTPSVMPKDLSWRRLGMR